MLTHEQFIRDLARAYNDVGPKPPLRSEFLTQIVAVFAEIYARDIQQAQHLYALFLKCAIDGIIAFTKQIHPACRECPEPTSVFKIVATLHGFVSPNSVLAFSQRAAYQALAAPFKRSEFHLFSSWRHTYPGSQLNPPRYPDDDASKEAWRRYEKYEQEHQKLLNEMTELATEYEAALIGSPLFGYANRLMPISSIALPFEIPEKSRMEHHWILATSGHGKTQCMQAMIARDLEAVAQNKASVVVIDSEEVMIPTLSRLKLFAPGQPLAGKLIYLDPKDVEYPLSFNLFDIGQEKAKDRHAQYQQSNEMLELFRFILGALLDKEMTSKQRDVFEFCALLLLSIPGATIQDFLNLLQPKGLDAYRKYLPNVDAIIRQFFENQYEAKGQTSYDQTKQEVSQRVYSMLRSPVFRDMFCNKKTKLDLAQELQTGKVILINTSESFLKKDGTKLFGRFMLALLANAASKRAQLGTPLPTYIYIDECYFYVKDDPNAIDILARGRKRNFALIMAHQWISQLGLDVPNALKAITAIKFAARLNESDCHMLAAEMDCEAEFIRRQPNMSFAAHIRGQDKSVSIVVPPLVVENMLKMTDAEFEAIRRDMRRRFSADYGDRYMPAASGSSHAPPPPPQGSDATGGPDDRYDLRWIATINPKKAVTGAKLRVHRYEVTIPPNTKNGNVIRLRGVGASRPDGTKGDIYITIRVGEAPMREKAEKAW